MRAIGICIVAAALFGCASTNGERQAPPKAAAASSGAGATSTASSPPAAEAGNAPAMTAADAAEKAHEDWVRSRRSAAAPQK
jgi:hypothetical protein